MAFTKLTKDMNIIQKLDDEPNDVGGLTSAELKAKFDEPANAVKDWINNTFIPEAEEALHDVLQESLASHALKHASGGSDPVTPAIIGAVSGYWKIYRLVSDLGLTDAAAAMENIFSAMRDYSELNCPVSSTWTEGVCPSQYGVLHVVKEYNSRGYAEFTDVNGAHYVGAYSNSGNNTFLGWKKLATTNVALLKAEKPSGSYTGNSTVPRTIETGGIGDMIAIRVVYGDGGSGPNYIVYGDTVLKTSISSGGTVVSPVGQATFHDGVLTLNHLNLNGSTQAGAMKYYYQVL